jgi:hypothetical protein
MIVESLVGLSLVLNVSLDAQTPPPANAAVWSELSAHQKEAVLLPLVLRATNCIVRKVSADKRYRADIPPADINDLIVDSIAACTGPVRTMVDAHNRMYGDGSGEAFLIGPYLDILPAAVVQQVRLKAR